MSKPMGFGNTNDRSKSLEKAVKLMNTVRPTPFDQNKNWLMGKTNKQDKQTKHEFHVPKYVTPVAIISD